MEFSGLQVSSVVAFTLLVGANYLSQTLSFGIGTNADISTMYPTLFTPAPWTNWMNSAVFVLQGLFLCYQAMPMNKYHPLFTEKVGTFYPAMCLLGCVWLVLYQNLWIGGSLLAMFGMLTCAWTIYSRVLSEFAAKNNTLTRLDWWLVQVPFAAVTSWTTIAFTANLFVWMQYMGWESIPWSSSYANTAILTNAIIAIVALLVPDPTYPMVIAWALAGIWWRNSETNPQVASVAITAALAITVANAIVSTSMWSVGSTILKRMPERPPTSAAEPRPQALPRVVPSASKRGAIVEEVETSEQLATGAAEVPPHRKTIGEKLEEFIEGAGGETEPPVVPTKKHFQAPPQVEHFDTATSMQA